MRNSLERPPVRREERIEKGQEKEREREGERVYDVTERMKSVGKSHDARYNAGVNLRTCQRRGVKARSP